MISLTTAIIIIAVVIILYVIVIQYKDVTKIVLLFLILGNLYFYLNDKIEDTVIRVDSTSIINVGNIDELLYEVNKVRKENNLPPVKYDTLLEKAAYIQAIYNYKNNVRGHDHPDYDNVIDKVKETGYKSDIEWFYCAENVTRSHNYNKSIDNIEEDIVQAYVNSPNHFKSLINSEVTKIGTYTIFKNNKLYNSLILSE